MIVRSLKEIEGTSREVKAENWKSMRLLLKEDGMGFSYHVTTLYAGTVTKMWYKNHLEAVLCIQGTGEIEDLRTEEKHRIEAGTMYALNLNDQHILRAETDLVMVCVFNPPCTGRETHDADGAYPLIEDDPAPDSAVT